MIEQEANLLARRAELMRVVGECLERYQTIESFLKILQPHMDIGGVAATKALSPDWREFIDSSATLGRMIGLFKKGVQSDQPEFAATYFDSIVDQRNDLVHHLLADPNRPRNTVHEIEARTAEVRMYFAHATPLFEGLLKATWDFAKGVEMSIRNDEHTFSEATKSINDGKPYRIV